jgi:hypothetical protein
MQLRETDFTGNSGLRRSKRPSGNRAGNRKIKSRAGVNCGQPALPGGGNAGNREGRDLENNTNFPSPCPHTSPCVHNGGSGWWLAWSYRTAMYRHKKRNVAPRMSYKLYGTKPHFSLTVMLSKSSSD